MNPGHSNTQYKPDRVDIRREGRRQVLKQAGPALAVLIAAQSAAGDAEFMADSKGR